MGNLGLEALTNDQALELLDELCQELASRDHWVREQAQLIIVTIGQKIRIYREAARQAVEAVQGAYCEQIRSEALTAARAEAKVGTLRLLSPDQEAHALVDADFAAKVKLLEETISAVQGGTAPGQPYMTAAERASYTGRMEYWDPSDPFRLPGVPPTPPDPNPAIMPMRPRFRRRDPNATGPWDPGW